MSTQSVNRGINIFIESGDAQKNFDKLQAKADGLRDKIKQATDPKVIKSLNDELNKLSEPLDRAAKKLSGQLKPSLNDLSGTVRNLRNELKHLSESDPGYEKKVLQLRAANLEYQRQLVLLKQLDEEKNGGGGGGKLGEVAKEAAAPLIALAATAQIIDAIKEFGNTAVEEFEQAEREAARFKNTLDAAGASDALPRLEGKVQKLADRFKFLDNDEIKGVFSQLITYGKLTEVQITKLIPVISDLYAKQQLAGNTSATLAESTSLVIKALEGNSKGLKEYGINIKDAGTVSERFGVVVDQLGSKIKGASETFAETLRGTIQIQQQEIKDLEEEVGGPLTELFAKIKLTGLNALAGLIKGAKEFKEEFSNLFLSRTQIQVNDFKKNVENLFAEADKTAASVVEDAANKPLAAQKKLLLSYGAILKAQREQYDLATVTGKIQTADGARIQKSYLETTKIVLALNEQIKRIQSGKTLGISTDTVDDKKSAKDFNLDDEEAKLLDRIKKALVEDSDVFTKKIVEINIQLDELLRGAKKKLDAYLADENTTLAQRNAAQKEFNQLSIDVNAQRLSEMQHQLEEADKQSELAVRNHNQRLIDEDKKLNQARLDAYIKVQDLIVAQVAKTAKQELGETSAADELAVFKSRGKAKLAAQIQQLKDQEAVELAAEDAIGSKRLLIIAEYEKKISDLKKNHIADTIQAAADFLSVTTNALNEYYNVVNARAQAEIDADTQVNDQKKKNLQNQLDGKLITQKQYQKQVDKLDAQVAQKERELRIKQFRQQQLTSIAQATVNVAEAVTKALTAGPISGQILAGITAAFGLAEIAIIAGEKPPSYEKGGFIPGGPSHSQGGVKLVDSNSGRIRGEIEGGEPILSRATYRNNKSIVDALLNTSMNRGGAPLNAAWRNAPVQYMNFPALQNSMQRKFATGGIAPGGINDAAEQNNATQLAMIDAVNRLNAQLDAGIRAAVSLTDFNKQQGRLNNIKADATAK